MYTLFQAIASLLFALACVDFVAGGIFAILALVYTWAQHNLQHPYRLIETTKILLLLLFALLLMAAITDAYAGYLWLQELRQTCPNLFQCQLPPS